LFWAWNKVGYSFVGLDFGLGHIIYDRPSRETMGVHGQMFGLWA
jgi:hypothetical protein